MFENGANALTIAQAYDLPKMAIYRWVKEDPEKEKRVEEYRNMRADGSADSVAQKADKYGDKRKLEVTQDTRVQHVQQLRDLNRKKIKDITPKKKQLKNNEDS